MPAPRQPPLPARPWVPLAAYAGALLLGITALASVGGPHSPAQSLLTVLHLLLVAGLPAMAYLLSAFGLGSLFNPLIRDASDRPALQLGLGLALMLSLSHGLGCLGLFGGSLGGPVALGICAVGLLLLARSLLRRRALNARAWPRVPWPAWLALPGLALLFAAACNPPGWLWSSEFGAYDALSYHLQLPQEWLALGRLTPVEHNVYSFLPGYIEAAFLHLARLTGAGGPGLAGEGPAAAWGLLGGAGDGARAISCQFLHAGLGVVTAFLTARATARAIALTYRREGDEPEAPSLAPLFAASLVLLTPWVVVVGSLAYNELGMAALFAAAALAATDTRLTAGARAAATGLLVGVACGCKPTALLFAGVPVGLLLLGLAPARTWPRLILIGAFAGLIALAPWLLRNWIACANPVFPYLSDVFGNAHWSPGQFARYRAGHSFDGSIIERLRRLVLPDPGAAGETRHRGLFHPQWFAFFPIVAASGAILLWHRPIPRVAILLLAGLALQLAAWLLTTHLQSRFLLPTIVPGAILFGLAVRASLHSGTPTSRPALRRAAGSAAATIALLAQASAGVFLFVNERGGRPNALLVPGPGSISGAAFLDAFHRASDAERRRWLLEASPEVAVNLSPPPPRLYLLGDATPFYFAGRPIYHTTWDRSPLGDAMRAAPSDPAAWSDSLLARGIRSVLVNFGELERLQRDGWHDPLVTAPAVRDWLGREGRLLRSWPERGQYLFELRATEPPR